MTSTPVPSGGLDAKAARAGRRILGLTMTLFFAFGFCTVLIDTLTPKLKSLFALNYTEATFTPFVFFAAYFLMSMPAAALVSRFGYLKCVMAGLGVMAVGCLLFTPAAQIGNYEGFLGAIFVLASGVTLVQVAANPLSAMVGDPRYSHSRLTLAQAFNSLATMVGPLFGAHFILRGSKPLPAVAGLTPEALNRLRIHEAQSVQGPFVAIAVALAFLAAVCALFLGQSPAAPAKLSGAYRRAIRRPRLMFGVASIFAYVGAEVAIGSLLTNYLMSTHTLGLPIEQAGALVSIYWGLAMVGRFIGALVLRVVRPGWALAVCAVGAGLLAATSGTTTGMTAAVAILGIGLCNAIMFPTIFTLAIEGLGEATPQGSGLLCLAIVGGAVIPLAAGKVADGLGLTAFLIVPIVCYAWILAYGVMTARGLGEPVARP